MFNLSKIPPIENDNVNAIIETPRDSYLKYRFDEERNIFVADKILPVGISFPFDFGFIPGTRGQDGDPLDALVIMDRPGLQGSLIECRLLGSLTATQKERDNTIVRNDRYFLACQHSWLFNNLKEITELGDTFQRQVEAFFVNYNIAAGKVFWPQGWKTSTEAMNELLRNGNSRPCD